MTDYEFERILYPFLYVAGPAEGRDSGALVAEACASAVAKFRDVVALRWELVEEYRDLLVDAASAMAERFARGGKLLAFGNGGSATDAQDAVADCLAPAYPRWRALPALSLAADAAVLTAIGNDAGFENIFRRQIIAFAEPDDIALGISTSGNSANVLAAFAEARRRGLLTIGLSGDEGGAVAKPDAVDYCFVVRVAHVPRIQEGHATMWHTLLELTQEALPHE